MLKQIIVTHAITVTCKFQLCLSGEREISQKKKYSRKVGKCSPEEMEFMEERRAFQEWAAYVKTEPVQGRQSHRAGTQGQVGEEMRKG